MAVTGCTTSVPRGVEVDPLGPTGSLGSSSDGGGVWMKKTTVQGLRLLGDCLVELFRHTW